MRHSRISFAGLLTAVAAAAALAACSSTQSAVPAPAAAQSPAVAVQSSDSAQQSAGVVSQSTAGAVQSTGGAVQSVDGAAPSTAPGSGTGGLAIDPCKKLTIADVQPFFTVPIATALPSAIKSDSMLGCEWSAAGGGGVPTSLDMLVVVGQDGQDRWTQANTTGKPEKLSGIGDEAEHVPGITDMWAMKGTGASAIWCGVTTQGWKELAGIKDLSDITNIPDASASAIADQYGLLCNKIFGSGNTTPTMTVAAPTGSAAVATASGPTAQASAAGGLMPGTDIPIPQGMDCSGSHTAKDTTGDLVCTATVADPGAAYNYFLQALPKAGYSINSKRYAVATNGKVLAGIGFTGAKFDGFNFISVIGTNISISLALG